ncbi:MAG: hypothetical protein EAZ81_06295 [Verrucomicrobia bacterium]|nr:MAG: hypothetical protein EAZ81_06295 [Verrucomicrobiota bacterium]
MRDSTPVFPLRSADAKNNKDFKHMIDFASGRATKPCMFYFYFLRKNEIKKLQSNDLTKQSTQGLRRSLGTDC